MAEQTRLLRGQLREHEPMSRHTSWRAGGTADRAYAPADIDDLREFLASLPVSEPVLFVGLGSNLLVRDGGLRATVILTHAVLNQVRVDGAFVDAQAGVQSPKVARASALHGLKGCEFMAGIPGTVGGALAMNAGCHGAETWDVVASVTTIDRAGQLRQRTRSDYAIGYRSVVPTSGTEEWFVAARFALAAGDAAESRATMKALLQRRIETQPLSQPNAGSVFRNPKGDYAARLIEACGLKGFTLGGAEISAKHANFIVNTGNASAADIETLVETAHSAVHQKFGIDLEREVRVVGEPAHRDRSGSA